MGVECELLQLETRTKKQSDVVPRRRLVGHDLVFEVTIPPHASLDYLSPNFDRWFTPPCQVVFSWRS